METNIKIIDSNGQNMNISLVGFFKVPVLEKEYVMYSLMDEDENNDMGSIMLGEVIRNDDVIQILGILKDEEELVVSYYNEISTQLGEE